MPGLPNQPGFEPAEEKILDLQRLIHMFLENHWWVIGITGFIFVMSTIYSYMVTPIYSATATIYVQSQSKQLISSQNLVGTNSWMEEEKFYNSQQQIIASRGIAQEVVDRLKLQEHPGFKGMKDPAAAFRGMMSVQMVRDSALFKITVVSRYREDVALWANTVAEVYAEQNLKSAIDYIFKANAIMLDQAKKLQEEYAKQQRQLAGVLEESGSYFPKNQKQIVDQGIEEMEAKLRQVKMNQNEAAVVVSQMEGWMAKGGDPFSLPAVMQDATAKGLADQYIMMERDLSKLEVKLTPQHPEIKKKRQEIDALKSRINSQAQIILQSFRNRLNAWRTEEAGLNRELDSLKRQGLQFAEGSTRGEALQTSTAAIMKYMDLLYDKMRELNLSSTLLTNNVRLVDPAMPPGAPIRPNKKMNMILSVLFGLIFSMGSLIAYQVLDTSIKSVDDIEQGFGLNLLTMIPTLGSDTERPTVEAFQSLRTALVYASQNNQKNVILVTSASPKDGKSSVISNLANIMAAGGDRVILMDCDLRRPSLHRFLKADSGKKGLTHFLADKASKIEDFASTGGRPNLTVVFSGPIPPNPPELFSMKRFKDLITKLRSEYDWVLLDSPPCVSITDAQILAGMADVVLVVARYRKTKKPLLQRALVTLSRMNAQIAGIVLNDVEVHSSYYYDYYYSSHYYYSTGTPPKKVPWLLSKSKDSWKKLLGSEKGSDKGSSK